MASAGNRHERPKACWQVASGATTQVDNLWIKLVDTMRWVGSSGGRKEGRDGEDCRGLITRNIRTKTLLVPLIRGIWSLIVGI